MFEAASITVQATQPAQPIDFEDEVRPADVATRNKRLMFGRQFLRAMVRGVHRDQQQQTAGYANNGKPYYESTSTDAATVFHRLGDAIKLAIDGETAALESVWREVEARAAKSGVFVWCKHCGDEMPDCRCPVKAPREG